MGRPVKRKSRRAATLVAARRDPHAAQRWHISHLEIAAPAQLAGDILRNVFTPALGRIEGDDADRIAILARKQVLDDGLKISGLIVGLPPGAADLPKIIGNEIDRLIA